MIKSIMWAITKPTCLISRGIWNPRPSSASQSAMLMAGSVPTELVHPPPKYRNSSRCYATSALSSQIGPPYYRDVVLQDSAPGNESRLYYPKLHLPIMQRDGIITSVWNNGIIVRPRTGELGILMITRRFDSDMLTKQKAKDGSNAPMGARIV